MANPICTTTTLITDAACYQQYALDPFQQKALLVYARVLQLAAIGGTDYTSAMTTTLLTDSACMPRTPDRIRAAHLAIAFANATAAGATVPSTIQTKISAAKCLYHIPGGMTKLDRIDVLLHCKLGVRKNYPQ